MGRCVALMWSIPVVVLAGRMIDAVASGGAASTLKAAQLAQQVRLIQQPDAACIHQRQQFQIECALRSRGLGAYDTVRAGALQHEPRRTTARPSWRRRPPLRDFRLRHRDDAMSRVLLRLGGAVTGGGRSAGTRLSA